MIYGRPRSASVVAIRATGLSILSRAAFEDLVESHLEFYKSLMTLIAVRNGFSAGRRHFLAAA